LEVVHKTFIYLLLQKNYFIGGYFIEGVCKRHCCQVEGCNEVASEATQCEFSDFS